MPPEARLRRNGQPQACEACRRTKVRCDHGSPRCSRCVMRRLDCVYHPAPMTKHRDFLTSPPLSNGLPSLNGSHHVPLSPITTPTEQQYSNAPSPGTSASGHASSALPGTTAVYEKAKRASLFQKEGVPYGTTRFSAVFSENQATFGPAIDDIDDSGVRGSSSGSNQPNRRVDVKPSRRELAIDTLLKFPTLRVCEILIERLPYMLDVWQSPVMIRRCLRQIWNDYGRYLGDNRSRESVSLMADEIFDNGQQPLPDQDYGTRDHTLCLNWFGGPRLRWEMIGIVFSWAGMIFKQMQEWDQIFELPELQGKNRKTSAEAMRECAVACLQLCDDFSEINDIIVILMKNTGKLHSVIISDESDHLRMHFGTVGSAFITAGLHRLPVVPEVTPLYQFRSSISSSLFYLDKCESLFAGRPPMFNRRYCHCPPPLDLDEEDVYNGHERLAAAIKKLDGSGWNTDGKIHTTTWLRALLLLAPIREEILDLSLTVNSHFSKSQIDDLLLELNRVVKSYPAHLQYYKPDQQQTSPFQAKAAREIYITSRIQLDVLQCGFLLQRLLVSRGLSNGQDLFDIALEMISVVLSFWSNREQLQHYNYAFDWILLSYGIPCAGILCLELLRASNLAPPMPASGAIPSPVPVQLSRSEVVQTLTMFIAFLNWIRPTDNNIQLCGKFKKVVKRIIDTAIDAPRPSYTAPTQQSQNQRDQQASHNQYQNQSLQQLNPQPGIDFMNGFDPALLAMDDLDWMNTVDWTQGDWLELSQQNFLY
ncbi:uncharacterized protein PAC_17019 [Phialocephala subalpina]|uniref:Zn(2)-C6 fungal-type domain-containing protein n=1 Tax=Phialocephala subalpina TaxID=576137 RepID=A0A1L7XQ10_9HELO|nr:uncharacterized protein PAC_17019 [Phialocephala subalpina]